MNANFDPKVHFWQSKLAQMMFCFVGVPRHLSFVLHTVKQYLEKSLINMEILQTFYFLE